MIVVLSVFGVVLALIALAALTPWLDEDLTASTPSRATYDQAMVTANTLMSADGANVRPECRSRVQTHGQKTEKSVVLLHGFTNCPAQYGVIAQAYYDNGYNVVVPRLPAHGLADRMTDTPTSVTAADLTRSTGEAIGIAAGLGDKVTVVGLSAGGSLAAWAAAQRDDVDEAVVISPLMLPKVLPDPVLAPFTRLARYLPDYYLWWDFGLRENLAEPIYAYPRYSLRNLAAFLAVGRSAQDHVTRTTPISRLVVITNENDDAVSNAPAGEFETRLATDALKDDSIDVPADKGWGHDLVSPQGENAQHIHDVYQLLGQALDLPDLGGRIQNP